MPVRPCCSTARRRRWRFASEPDQTFDNVKPAVFAVRGCEVAVPPGAVAAVLDGKPLPLARPNPQRILMFGDTGCRLGDRQCVPGLQRSGRVAVPARSPPLAATARPDLVIHVGDYHYRESACPIDDRGCAGSPWGYGWDAWNADFFAPAAPLLAAAPWVMVRGNHEDCSRAGEGWFRFMDRAPMERTCRDLTGIFVARLGDFGVVVVDDAKAADPKGDPSALVDAVARPVHRDPGEGAGGGLDGEPPSVQFHAQRTDATSSRTRSTTTCSRPRSAR